MKKLLLNLYYWPMFLLVTVIGFGISPLLLLGNLPLPQPTDRMIRRSIRVYGWFLIRVIPFMAPAVLDDRSGGFARPAIFVPNHCSSLDPYLFGLLPLDNAFVTSWPFKIPFYNFFMHLARYIDSTRGWPHVQTEGKKLLAQGCSLIIWPEGHRSRDGQLRRFKNGAFQLALATGRPIVPVCILGSREMLPPGSRLLNPARIRVVLLPPITPVGSPHNSDDIKSLKNQTRAIIAATLAAARQAAHAETCNCSMVAPKNSLPDNKVC